MGNSTIITSKLGAFGQHISHITHRSFSSDASSLLVLPASTTIVMNKKRNNKIWQRDGPEGQQLKQDVLSSFHDGSLNIDNPAYMVLYQKSELYGKFKMQVFRKNVKAVVADLAAQLANSSTYSMKGESG
jgi:hypothetical protein